MSSAIDNLGASLAPKSILGIDVLLLVVWLGVLLLAVMSFQVPFGAAGHDRLSANARLSVNVPLSSKGENSNESGGAESGGAVLAPSSGFDFLEREDRDWPLFRGDPRSTGTTRTEIPDRLEVVWQREFKGRSFEGTPIIVGGPDAPKVYLGDVEGNLMAIDLANGEVEWSTAMETEVGFVTAPAYRQNRLYIGDLDGYFHCFDLAGKKLWTFETEGEIDSSGNFDGDHVLFGSQDTRLYALDAVTGKLAWQVETVDQIRCSPTVVQHRAFVAGCDGSLHVIDLEQGQEVASVPIESPTGVTPAARGDRLFVGTEQAGFYCIDWKRARVVWHYDDPPGGISTRSSPALVKGQVVFGAANRRVYSLDSETGKLNWSRLLKAKIESSPIIVGDRVFVGSLDGRFYELSLESGAVVWEKQLRGRVIGSPAAAWGRLVIATDRGLVYCLGAAR